MITKSLEKFLHSTSTLGRWLPVFLWAAVIFFLSSVQVISVSEFFAGDFIFKKSAHITEYAVLFALIFRATKQKWLLSFALTILYSASDEFHQSFVLGRSASVIDLGFDASGANIAAYLIWKLNPNRKKKQKK